MAGRQTFRILIVGKSGSGKSTLARQIIQRMEGRYRHLVVVNRKREFAELVQGRYTVGEEGDPTPALRKHRRVIFQVTGYDPRPFLDALGQAIMQMRDVLLVMDEAHLFFPKGQTPKGLFEVLTGGREAGHSTLFITQMLQGATGGIDPGVRRQASHLVTFRVTEPREVQAVADMFPELGEGLLRVERQYTLQGNRPGLGPLKSRAARRVIPLPDDLAARLESERTRLLQTGLSPESLKQGFVFGLDKPLDVNTPNHYLRRLVERIRQTHPDFPLVRIHDLRHTAASLMLARGVDVALAAERLGHATANVTLGVYRHLLQEEKQGQVYDLEALLTGSRHQA